MKKEKIQNSVSKTVATAMAVWLVGSVAVTAALTANELKAQAKETKPIAVEAVFYDVPIDIDLLEYIQGLCCDYEIPVELVLAVIEVESSYKADAVSVAGAKGLMQVIPEHHKPRMNRLKCTDLFNPQQNVTVGMDFLAELLDTYNGNTHKALTAYNHGEKGANNKFFSKGVYQTKYSRKVLKTAEKIKEGMTEMFYTDDPVKDYDRYAEEQNTKLEKLPRCSECDKHIQDEHCYEINDELICQECLDDNHRKSVEDYVE